ncbi:MAG: LacI family DNA-binding transcriptional regulator [Bryobacteraceae bacterium]
MATIKQVAQRAKVSVGTVSNVVSGAVPVSSRLRKRVLAAIRELDYHPNQIARSLKTRQTKMLGMVIPDITNPFFPQAVRGAEDAASEHGYLLVTFNTDDHVERERKVLSQLRSRRFDGGLLVLAPNSGDFSHVENTLAAGIPLVCVDRIPARLQLDTVMVENAIGARSAVRHLISMGHREIGVLAGPATLANAHERLEGYKQALAEANLPVRPELIRQGDFRIESGHALGRELLTAPKRPTALFVCNGMMALGMLRALEELGLRCPEDLALAVFDDLQLASALRPHLTSVVQPVYQIGYKGASMLIARVEGTLQDPAPVKVRLATELKIRESSLGYKWREQPVVA